jgi:iron complex outermembrane receptor protein
MRELLSVGAVAQRAVCLAGAVAIAAPAWAQRELADLSLEELADLEVISVSRRSERLSEAPASIFVITADDIRRSGVRSLPEALRLAPNLQVARIDASQYAISARGFNNAIGNKLLVMVDGRTIYTPLFSGVFWDQQDVMLEDVQRIEVISGPGATLWGANAVNGVINVITRPAGQTQGALASVGMGNRDRDIAVRFGGELGPGHYRAYAKAREVAHSRFAPGGTGPFFPGGQAKAKSDGREHVQMGFRGDWGTSADRFTLQGDVYEGDGEDPAAAFGLAAGRHAVAGGNLLARWSRELQGGGDLRLQAYLDHSKRQDRVLFQPDADIFDLEMQHGLPLGNHRLLWGAGYRYGRDKVRDAVLSGLRPRNEELEWYNVFGQAEIRLTERVELIPGIKFEQNRYSGTEALPSLRLAWKPASGRLIWAAASRAVRAPSRFDRDVVIPTGLPAPIDVLNVGGRNFDSEVADVYELGYRAQAGTVTYSATLFRHEWDRLRSARIVTGILLTPFELANQIEGTVYGIEGWAAWRVRPWWQLSGGLVVLRKDLRLEPGATDPVGPDNITLAADPEYQWSLRSAFDIGERQQLDVMVRHVARLPPAREGGGVVPALPAYTGLDLRYAWRMSRELELSLTVQNLQERWHSEFRTTGTQPPGEIERSILLGLRWTS